MTDGVTGQLPAGETEYADGTKVAYAYSSAAGFRDLEVRLDGQLVTAVGTIEMNNPHLVQVSALPSPAVSSSPEMAAMMSLYGNPNSQTALPIFKRVVGMAFKGDITGLQRYAQAEAFVLEQKGPDSYTQLEKSLAGKTFLITGDSTAPSAAALQSQLNTFPADTVVPTTVIFVNGILNFTGGQATNSARGIIDLLVSTGFHVDDAVYHQGSPRQAASMRVMLHFNPVIATQNPLTECIATLGWALNVATGMNSDGSRSSIWLRAVSLLEKAARITKACTDPVWVSTNARVLDQFLTANASLLAPIDANDRDLVSLIENERALAGGRNVWVIGHSQGTMIAHSAIGLVRTPNEGSGCIAALSVASPLSNALPWPGANVRDAITQKGAVEGSEDLVYNLLGQGQGRTDGMASGLTAVLDADITSGITGWRLFLRKLGLHSFMDSYLNAQGQRAALTLKMRKLYGDAGTACAGTLEGQVGDISTRHPIVGAKVQPIIASVSRGSPTTTTASGAFRTGPLLPILHDLQITAPGYDTVVLTQRLVPFRASAQAQAGMILLGKACASSSNCVLSGSYDINYQLSGTIGSMPVACAFSSHIIITNKDSTFSGIITTDNYQEGCDDGAGRYVYWNRGTASMHGSQRGREIIFTHEAQPPWEMTGRTFEGGFTASEPRWKISDSAFALRVELVATRRVSAIRLGSEEDSSHPSRGPAIGIRR